MTFSKATQHAELPTRSRVAATASSSPSSLPARATSTAAEDALSEAFASALADWPVNGCPRNPEGWLLTVARRKLIDGVRRRQTGDAVGTQLQILAEGLEDAAAQAEKDMEIPDKRLALLFACAHPAIEAGIRAPLMLQVVLGLDGEKIASAFLVSPAAMRKRLSRAKEKIQQAGIPFSVPEREELPERLDTVLAAIYAGFAEGWTDPSGTDAIRRDLTEEAIFLARLVVELLPQEAEATRSARVDASCRSAARARGATPTANTCRSPSRTRRCGTRR